MRRYSDWIALLSEPERIASERTFLIILMILTVLINVVGIDFGRWHPDEVTRQAFTMGNNHTIVMPSYRYGALHVYLALTVMVPIYGVTEILNFDSYGQQLAMLMGARVLTAVLAAGCVGLAFYLGCRLINFAAGLWAALMLMLAVGFVNMAHFATVDVPMLFWVMASTTAAALVMLDGRRRYYLIAGICAGLAGATKYNGIVVVLMLPVAHLLQAGPRDQRILLFGLLGCPAAFILANLPIFVDSCRFLEALVVDNAFNSMFATEGPPMFQRIFERIAEGQSIFFAILAICASLFAFVAIAQREQWRSRVFLLAATTILIIPILSVHYLTVRHVVLLLPFLSLIVADMLVACLRSSRSLLRYGGTAALAMVLVPSLAFSTSAELQFVYDSRKLAAEWIEQHVPAGAGIEVTDYGPDLDASRYRIVERPTLHRIDDTLVDLPNAAIYRGLWPVVTRYTSLAESLGVCPVKDRHYTAWFERAASESELGRGSFQFGLPGLRERKIDYIILSSQYYKRWEGDASNAEADLFKNLLNGLAEYPKVKTFHAEFLPFGDPELEMMNPVIHVYKRVEPFHEAAVNRGS